MPLRRSLAFSFIDRYSGLLIGVISSMILARLLTPAEVGIYSIVMVLLALANTLRDMGAGQYLLQEKELTNDRIRAVWTVQLGLGLLVAVLVCVLAPFAAAFYAEPRMLDVMLLLALNYVINPVGSVTYAWLMRQMRFDAIAVIRFSSGLSTAIVSVALVLKGHGPISLAWGSLVGTLTTAMVSAFFRPVDFPWLPGLREVRRVLTFGTKLTSTSVLNTLTNGFPEFILAKLDGLTASGYFSRANGLVGMFHRLISDSALSVAIAVFSQKSRDSQDLSLPFLKGLSYLTVLGWAFAAAMIPLAHPIIRLLYGNQWDEAVGLTRVLALSMVLSMPIKLCHSVLLGTGNLGRIFRATVLSASLTILLAAIGAPFGMLAIGTGLAAASAISTVIWLVEARSVVRFEWKGLFSAMLKDLLTAIGTGLVPFAVSLTLGFSPPNALPSLLVGLLGAVVGFLACIFLVRHPIAGEVKNLFESIIRYGKRRWGK